MPLRVALVIRSWNLETELSRARNKEKEKTILSAAVRIVAADGVGASIARITKEAEISVCQIVRLEISFQYI